MINNALGLTRREYLNKRKTSLELERQSFMAHWKELGEYNLPRRGRFFIQDRNKGDKRWASIINSKATQCLQIATSGMLAGTMSPTRPWFSLETNDPDLMEHQPVKDWLYRVELILRTVFNDSNFYGQASQLLSELILFGTSAMSHVDDFNDVARFYTHTAGSYCLGANDRCEVDTLLREWEWTAGQIVKAYGIENVSQPIKDAINRKEFDKWFPVCHIIEPNDEYRSDSKLARNKLFKSVVWEPGNNAADADKWLSLSGFDEFPVYAPRWYTTDGDVYSVDCPGMTALGDVKGLQIEEKRKAQAIDKMVNPPLQGPPSVRNAPVNALPGGLTIYDDSGTGHTLKPLYEVKPQIQELRMDMEAVERRIEKAFFVDMFLAITNIEGIQPRNQLDLMQRNEERLLQLGPVLERLQSDFLDPLIDRTFNQCLRAKILPPPPEELSEQPLRVKYVSTLAMAQRAVATQGIDRMAAFAGNLAQLGWQGAYDKFDADQAIDEYARAVGIPPSVIVSDDVVAERRAAAQAQQQAMQMLEMAQGGANAAKMAADAKTKEPNLLTEMMGEAR